MWLQGPMAYSNSDSSKPRIRSKDKCSRGGLSSEGPFREPLYYMESTLFLPNTFSEWIIFFQVYKRDCFRLAPGTQHIHHSTKRSRLPPHGASAHKSFKALLMLLRCNIHFFGLVTGIPFHAVYISIDGAIHFWVPLRLKWYRSV